MKTRTLYIILGLIFLFAFIFNLGSYPLLEVDETRYVTMSQVMFDTKNFLTLYLNGDYFFEKPPLFFWIECLSFQVLGISELSARLPIVLLSLLPIGLLIFLCKKVKDSTFSVITTAVLFTSLQYILITKIAILDSVLTSFVSSSVLCYFATFFVEDKNKKYFWALTYIFSALAVLAKGIPGIAIPMLVIAVSSFVFKSYKDTLKNSWRIILFLLITLPWHLVMLKMYGNLFFDEYIIKHHLLRFLGSEVIHRNEPFYFYFLTLLWGLFPHIFVLISKIPAIKNIRFNLSDNYSKFLVLNLIATIMILGFFSMSGAKLITYILPVYPFTSVLIAHIWLKYINNNDNSIKNSLIILDGILFIAALLLCFAKFAMPAEIYTAFRPVQISAILIIVPFIICNLHFLIKQKRLQVFLSLAIFISLLSGILTPYIYKFNYTFGQNDLMRFAQIAKNDNVSVSTYLTGKKYSLLYYGSKTHVDFQTEENAEWLKNELNKGNNMLITRNKFIDTLPVQVKIKEKGIKYSIIEF